MNQIKTAVIGTGYLGKYHVEKFAASKHAQLLYICDINPDNALTLSSQYGVPAVYDYRSLAGKIEAVSIATPTPTHYDIGAFFLSQGVHVLMEKPITQTLDEADQLIALAKNHQVVLQVGHLERFNQVIKSAQKILTTPKYIESRRLSPFKLRGSDVNVVLDLMIHDIDIILSMVKSPITDLRAMGSRVLTPFLDIVNARLEFENGCVASITGSRVNQFSERRLRIFQPDAYIDLDLHHKKSRVQQKGKGEMFPGIPNIDYTKNHFEPGDALRDQIESFLEAIVYRKKPVVTGEDARHALSVAHEITRIVENSPAGIA